MLAASALRSRVGVALLIGLCAGSVFLLFAFNGHVNSVGRQYAQQAQHFLHDSFKGSYDTQVYGCADPYRRPGYLHIDRDDYRKTRWIPYTSDFLDAPPPESAKYPRDQGAPDLFFNISGVEEGFRDVPSVPREWMLEAIAEEKRRREAVKSDNPKKQKADDFAHLRNEGGLGWLWGRRVLLISDSVDRYMMQFFCEEFGGGHITAPAAPIKVNAMHTTGECTIPAFNLTLVHWHYPGSWTFRPDWWWMDNMELVAFEERWPAIYAPTIDTLLRGPRGRPDLLLWQSGLWDQRALWQAGEAHFTPEEPMGKRERHLQWDEIRFIAARIQKLATWLRGEFGADTPTMFRSLTEHRDSNATDANLFELDRVQRAVAERNGHEVFEWGRIITAFSMLYKDRTHTDRGPASWLWANMVMEYLARSAAQGDPSRAPYFDGWDSCHDELVNWGGR